MALDRPFTLVGGETLPRLDIAVETYGRLNGRRDNAVLVCHGLTSDQNAAGTPREDGVRPWWQSAIGPGRMLDTDRWFVVCANVPGGSGGSTGPRSIDPRTGRPFALGFPRLTIADFADASAVLLDCLGIDRLAAAIGGCMGGFHVLELARRHPARLARAIAISATPETSAYTIALWELMRQAIYADPAWNGGDYYGTPGPLTGVGMAAMIGSVLWLDRDTLAAKFGRRRDAGTTAPALGLPPDFAVETFLAQVRGNARLRFDPNSLILLTKAVDAFDLADDYANLSAGVATITAPTLLVSYEDDWRYPRDGIARLADAIDGNGGMVEHHHLHSAFGHGAFQFDVAGLAPLVERFLATDQMRTAHMVVPGQR